MNRLIRIKDAALLTIKYFDLHDYPLKTREVHRYLFKKRSLLRETEEALKELGREEVLGNKGDHWFLINRPQLVAEREKKEKISIRLRQKLKIFGWLFKITPFIRTVAICNSLSFNNAGQESDIDLLILTRRDRLWTVRFISTGLAAILGLKKKKFQKVDPSKFCLSFYLSEDRLDLKEIGPKNDLFRIFWLGLLDPIYDHGLFSLFLEANHWALKSLPNFRIRATRERKRPLSLIAFLLEKLIEALPFDPESRLYNQQKKRIKKGLPADTPANKVIAEKGIFKSHLGNRRREINQELKKELQALLSTRPASH